MVSNHLCLNISIYWDICFILQILHVFSFQLIILKVENIYVIIRVKIMRKSIFRGLLDSYLQHAVFVPFGLYRQCFFLQRKDVSLYVCIFFLFFYTEDSIPYTLFQTLLFHWIIFPGEYYTFLITWGIPESKSLLITYFCHYFLGKSWTCFCST